MAKRVQDLIDSLLEKSDARVYVPVGRPQWRVSTGVASLDILLGGGIPSGAFVHIYGPEQSGKTSLVYRMVGEAVRAGKSTLLCPIEGYDKAFAQACGIDTESENFHVLSATNAESLFYSCIRAIREYDVKVLVLDSIAAAIPRADLEKKQKLVDGDPGFSVGARAKSITHFVRQLKEVLENKGAIFVTVNQYTAKITSYGGSLHPGGGEALQYASDIKIRMRGTTPYFKDDTPLSEEDKVIVSDVSIMKGKLGGVKLFSSTTLYL